MSQTNESKKRRMEEEGYSIPSTPPTPSPNVSDSDEEMAVKTPTIHKAFVLKHPRVVLAYLRFIDLYNEQAEGDEIFMMPAIPKAIVERILRHSSCTSPDPDFKDVNELKERLERHMDLSS